MGGIRGWRNEEGIWKAALEKDERSQESREDGDSTSLAVPPDETKGR